MRPVDSSKFSLILVDWKIAVGEEKVSSSTINKHKFSQTFLDICWTEHNHCSV